MWLVREDGKLVIYSGAGEQLTVLISTKAIPW